MKIWDGKTLSRATLDSTKAPDYIDYLRIVNEIQQLQDFVISLSQNTTIMPNLEEELQKAYLLIEQVRQEIQTLVPPDDLMLVLKQFSAQLETLNNQEAVIHLQRKDIDALRNLVATNQLQVLKLQKSLENDVKGFQNRVWNTLTSLQKEFRDRLEVLESNVSNLTTQVSIAKLLGQLQ
jgi:hypothetical protein